MNWPYVVFLACSSLHALDSEIRDVVDAVPKNALEEALAFLDHSESPPSDAPAKCSIKNALPLESHPSTQTPYKLFLFTSFSLPLESWQEHSSVLEKIGGAFVLRGLPHNSFSALSQKIAALRKVGVKAEILLDPVSFDTYAITAIPTLVLDGGTHRDVLPGNISIRAALSSFADRGETHTLAQQLLKHLEEQR